MPIGAIGQGIARAFAQYIGGERQRRRQAEDASIDEQMSLIKALSDRPDANPALLGKALHDLTALSEAKAGKRSTKGGMEGFMGSSDLPLSQFLEGISRGSRPMVGRTSQLVPQPPIPATPYQATTNDMGEVQEEVFAKPARAQAPKRIPLPDDQQPLLRDPMEMAEEAGQAEALQYAGRTRGQREADVEMLRELGATDDQIAAAMLRKYGGTGRDQFQTYNFQMADGSVITAVQNKATDQWDTPDGQRPQGRLIGVGPTNQLNYFTDDFGNVSGVAANRNNPNITQSIPVPPGVVGRSTPEGPPVQFSGPDGVVQVGRFPRQGTEITPATIGAGGRPAIAAPPVEIRSLPVRMASLDSIVQEIDQMSLAISTGEGFEQVARGLMRKGASYLGWDDPVRLYEEIKGSFSATLSRLAGEVGVLTDQDVQRALGWVPKTTDSVGVRNEKIRLLRTFIQEKKAAANAMMGQGLQVPNAPPVGQPPLTPGQEVTYQGRRMYFKGYGPNGEINVSTMP